MKTKHSFQVISALVLAIAPLAHAERAKPVSRQLKTSFVVYTNLGPVLPLENTNKLIPAYIRKQKSLLEVTKSMLDITEAAGGIRSYEYSAKNELVSVTVPAYEPYRLIEFAEASEVNGNRTRYYGWCFAINQKIASQSPEWVKVQRHDQVVWFYGHVDTVNGVFLANQKCTPEYAPLAAVLN